MSALVGISWFDTTRRTWLSKSRVRRDEAAAMAALLVRDPAVQFVTVDDEDDRHLERSAS